MIDLLDPELHARGDIDGELDELRARCPVAWRDGRRGPGYWAVTGHAELVAVARDPASFTSHWGTRPEVRRAADAPRPLHNMDPPAHARIRAIGNQLVAPSAALARSITTAVTEAIDAFLAAGGGDAIPALAITVPARVFAAWLGVDDPARLATRVEAVHTAGARLLDDMSEAHRVAARAAASALGNGLRDAIATGTAPAGSVLAALHAHVGRGALTLLEATMLATLLVEAGLPTTSDAIAGGLATCLARPADVALAVEEILRVASPIQQFGRYATRDLELGGASIRAGQQVILWYGAANRDPRVFAEPAVFAARARNPHVAFGAGPHRCLGARFARDLLRAFFTAWFARVPRHTAVGERRASSYLRGYRTLIVTQA